MRPSVPYIIFEGFIVEVFLTFLRWSTLGTVVPLRHLYRPLIYLLTSPCAQLETYIWLAVARYHLNSSMWKAMPRVVASRCASNMSDSGPHVKMAARLNTCAASDDHTEAQSHTSASLRKLTDTPCKHPTTAKKNRCPTSVSDGKKA